MWNQFLAWPKLHSNSFLLLQVWKGERKQAAITRLAMSTASKVTLAVTTLGAIGIVVSVHYGQKAERAVSLIPFLLSSGFSQLLGNACRCYSRYGATEAEEGAPA